MKDAAQQTAANNCGTPWASEELLTHLYDELRRIAYRKLAQERPGQTLQPTALVHEAWLRLGGSSRSDWNSRTHFFGAAAEAMRRILVESARRKHRVKHGGEYQRVEMDDLELAAPMPDAELLALDEALTQLAEIDAEAAQLVSLRFFTGLTQVQAAEEMGISRSTADRTWVFARAWLYERIQLKEQGAPTVGSHPPGKIS